MHLRINLFSICNALFFFLDETEEPSSPVTPIGGAHEGEYASILELGFGIF